MNNNSVTDQVMGDEIDLLAYLLKLKSQWKFVLISSLVGCLLGLCYGLFLVTPLYTSTAKVYLRGSSSSISIQDLQLGSQLTSDYSVIFKSRTVLENVVKDLGLDYSASGLAGMISISNPSGTHILEVSVTSDDPNKSAEIANSVVDNSIDTVLEIDAQSPYVIDKAIPVNSKVNHSATYYAMIGTLGLTVAYCGLSFVMFVYNDTIKSSEDVIQFLGLPVLTVVPEDAASARKKGKK